MLFSLFSIKIKLDNLTSHVPEKSQQVPVQTHHHNGEVNPTAREAIRNNTFRASTLK